MIPHAKSWNWLNGEDMCTECNEDWPCRDMRMWQAGHRAGLEEARKEFMAMNYWHPNGGRWVDYGKRLDAKLKEQA